MKGTINFVEEHIRKIKRGNNVRGVITGGGGASNRAQQDSKMRVKGLRGENYYRGGKEKSKEY